MPKCWTLLNLLFSLFILKMLLRNNFQTVNQITVERYDSAYGLKIAKDCEHIFLHYFISCNRVIETIEAMKLNLLLYHCRL